MEELKEKLQKKLQDKIIAWLEARHTAAGESYRDGRIAEDIGVSPTTVASVMTGLIKAKRVERTAPRLYRLFVPEAVVSHGGAPGGADEAWRQCAHDLAIALDYPPDTGWSVLLERAQDLAQSPEGVPKARRAELAKALGIPNPRTWGELLAGARAVRADAYRLAPKLPEALALPCDAAPEMALARVAQLRQAEVFSQQVFDTLFPASSSSPDEALERLRALLLAERELLEAHETCLATHRRAQDAEARAARLARGLEAVRAVAEALEE